MAISTFDLDTAAAGTGASVTFTEQTGLTLFPRASLTTSGSGSSIRVDQITISIGSATASETLSVAASVLTANGVTATYSNGVLTLSKTNGTDAVWAAVLKAVVYNNTSDAPPTGGRTITVIASDTGNGITSTTVANVAVTAVNDPTTGSVTLAGTATQGSTLTASNTLADPDGMGVVTYQWLRNGVAIGGATGSTYVLAQADVGAAVSVRASYTDGGGTAGTVSSTATGTVANVNDAPTGAVTITGTAAQGSTLTASNSLADADGMGTVAYQWLRNGVAISG
ncbi:MAG TPA: hypothetical protein VF582_09485, partial [Allosphingosinicella sp.]